MIPIINSSGLDFFLFLPIISSLGRVVNVFILANEILKEIKDTFFSHIKSV